MTNQNQGQGQQGQGQQQGQQADRNREQLREKMKAQWPKLSDDDLSTVEGNPDELARVLQERQGFKEDEAQRQVNDFRRRHQNLYSTPEQRA